MNDLQKKQLEILKQFIRVCEKHNLTYFLVGGSCLGAARHQGFIPWDDDIDVGMPREDFNKYVELQKEYEGTSYFIQTWKSDPHYTYNYAKLRDSSTTYIENFFVKHQINHGVWIDIFPIDGFAYKFDKPRDKYAHLVSAIWRQSFISYFPQMRRKFSKGTWFTDLFINLLAILTWPFDINHWRRKHTEKLLTKVPFKDAEVVGNMCGINKKKEAMDKSIYLETTKLPFEDIEVCVPKDYDKYLTLLYNDWRKWPPKEKQVGHHHDKGLSLTQGYKSYMKEHKI